MGPLLLVLGVLFLRIVGARPVVEDGQGAEKRPTLTIRAETTDLSDPFAIPTYSFSIPNYPYSFSFPTYSYSFPIPTYSYSFPQYSYSFPTYSYSFPTYSYSFPNYTYSFPTYSYPIPTFDPGASTGGSTFTSSTRRRTSTRTIIGAVVGSVTGFLSILGGIWAAMKRRARRAMGNSAAGDAEKPPVSAVTNVPPLGYAPHTPHFEQAPLLSSGTPPPPSQPHRPPAEPYVPTAY